MICNSNGNNNSLLSLALGQTPFIPDQPSISRGFSYSLEEHASLSLSSCVQALRCSDVFTLFSRQVPRFAGNAPENHGNHHKVWPRKLRYLCPSLLFIALVFTISLASIQSLVNISPIPPLQDNWSEIMYE